MGQSAVGLEQLLPTDRSREGLALDAEHAPQGGLGRRFKLALWNRVLRRLPLVAPALRDSQKWAFRESARSSGAGLYHEPNFIAMPFEGPVVVTVHDLSVLRHPETHPAERVRFMSDNMGESLHRADRIVTVSEFVRQEVIEVFGSVVAHKTMAIHNGVSDHFQPWSQARAQETLARHDLVYGQYLLALGTLEPRKNLVNLLKAYRLAGPLPPLVLVGDTGWEGQALKDATHAYRDLPIRVLGYLPQEDLPFVVAGARMMCYPSFYEGFGLPLVEAMASGVPVLSSTARALTEVLAGSGLQAEAMDIDGLAAGLRRLHEDEAFRRACMEGGLQRARQFSWRKTAAQLSGLYTQLAPQDWPA